MSGVDFSNTDDGKVVVAENINQVDLVGKRLVDRLNEALRAYSSQPIVWAEPVLSKVNATSQSSTDGPASSEIMNELLANPRSTMVMAPPQFGLTCLAHHMIKEAWHRHSARWLFLDASAMKLSTTERYIRRALAAEAIDIDEVQCVVVDGCNQDKEKAKLLRAIIDKFKHTSIVVMLTMDDVKCLEGGEAISVPRDFEQMYLLALSRGRLRAVVTAYNQKHPIGDDDVILSKVVSDLDILNIHRTPLNCLTLLKIAEKHFDESPVNRTKMLEMVLFLLFNTDVVPGYKTKPDLKDCEYVLGRLCEKMLRTENYGFTRENFCKELMSSCAEKLIDLEIDVVFDVLYANNIITLKSGQYQFRYSYWVFYFAALRMHSDAEFASYVLEGKKYVSYPELIEFYTGIDRNRADALRQLMRDLCDACNTVQSKVGLPDGMNPLRNAKWTLTETELTRMQDDISEDVLKSKLPDEVKDRYADRAYNPVKPYDQSIFTILREYSLLFLMQNIKASARALRNSDYVEPDLKREMLNEIMRSWEQVTKVVTVLAPVLAERGDATFGGLRFVLDAQAFKGSFEQRTVQVFQSGPQNVVNFFREDLFSAKMGPLLFDHMASENNDIRKHELALLLISERPRGWKDQIQDYIGSIAKDSYYLLDVLSVLRREYKYSFASSAALAEIAYLIKMTYVKHKHGLKKPGPHEVAKISQGLLPKRGPDDS